MCVNLDYFIREETVAILNRFNVKGDFQSLVIEGEYLFEVNESPLKVIENSLKYYGNSLERAIKGVKNVLGNVSMPPVQICCKLGIYWFSSNSPIHADCVWFAVHHIDNYHQLTEKMLKIYLRNGFEIIIDSNYSVFDSIVNRTKELKVHYA